MIHSKSHQENGNLPLKGHATLPLISMIKVKIKIKVKTKIKIKVEIEVKNKVKIKIKTKIKTKTKIKIKKVFPLYPSKDNPTSSTLSPSDLCAL